MWIVLLDYSGSMGEPFSGDTGFSGRSTKSPAVTKLQAAVTSILDRILGRNPEEHIAIIGFTSKAHLIVEGKAGDFEMFKKALNQLEATNGTDLGSALLETLSFVTTLRSKEMISALLVTDGKSDADPSIRARNELIKKIIQLSVILIDPTPDADFLLRKLLYNGEIQAVTSEKELSKELNSIDQKQKQFAQEVETILENFKKAESITLKDRDSKDDLSFTTACPSQILPELWVPFLFYFHNFSLSEYIRKLVSEKSNSLFLNPSINQTSSNTTIPKGTELTITLHLENVSINPREFKINWEEDYQELVFKVRASNLMAGKYIFGNIDIKVSDNLIGAVPVSTYVTDTINIDVNSNLGITQSSLFRRVFASYSRKDEEIVKSCVKTYEALGIHVYLDKQDLRSSAGDPFKEALKRAISESDVFQLYWSIHSSKSEWIKFEWEFALSQTGGKGQRFIRPLVWNKQYPKLPNELSGLQLGHLDLDQWNSATSKQKELTRIASASLDLEPVVIPILPGIGKSTLLNVRSDVAFAIRFLESTTGLRYYPVPTLLVDEFVVQSVRKELTVDSIPNEEESSIDVLIFADVLNCLSLELLNRFSESMPANIIREEFDRFCGKGLLFEPDFYDAIMKYCEWAINYMTREHPYISRWKLANAYPESVNDNISLHELVRKSILQSLEMIKSGLYKPDLHSTILLNSEEYECIKPLIETIKIPIKIEKGLFNGIEYHLKITSERIVDLVNNLLDEIEEEVKDFSLQFSQKGPKIEPSIKKGVLKKIILHYLGGSQIPLIKILGEIIRLTLDHPSWKKILVELISTKGNIRFNSDMNAIETLKELLGTICEILDAGTKQLGNYVISTGYSIPKESWLKFKKMMNTDDISVEIKNSSYYKEENVYLSASFQVLTNLYKETSNALIKKLSNFPTSSAYDFFTVSVPTYGIFTPKENKSVDEQLRKWARDQGIYPDLTLPESSKVLLCFDALDRFKEKLREEELSTTLCMGFQRSVLVHEHFHAILALGFDDNGNLPNGPKHTDAWQEALPVNESLAAWIQLHSCRDQPEIQQHILEYIALGKYPDWPYGGALAIEAAYQENGLPVFHKWMHSLRNDPIVCRQAFDEFVVKHSVL